VQPQAGPVQGGQQDQADSQPGNRHEANDGHGQATRPALPSFQVTLSDRARCGAPAKKSP
jgi:hypothetical protein